MSERKFLKSHEWAMSTGDVVQMGISEHASTEMGDIVFVNLPAVGDTVVAGEVFGDLESVKSVSDIYSLVTGVVSAVNEELLDNPALINDDAYAAWMVEVSEVSAWSEALSEEEYEKYLEEL